eukprot:m51a1_g4841 hypothetical protein (459) ;mRNA; r:222043-223971
MASRLPDGYLRGERVKDVHHRTVYREADLPALAAASAAAAGPAAEWERETRYTLSDHLGRAAASGVLEEVPGASADFAAAAGLCAGATVRGTRVELDRAWRVCNAALSERYERVSLGNAAEVVAFHGSAGERVLSIAEAGFNQCLTYRSTTGAMNFLGRMIYFGMDVANALSYADESLMVLACRIKTGNVMVTEERQGDLTPEALRGKNINAVFSRTVSKRGEILAIPEPSQVLPAMVLLLRKVRKSELWLQVGPMRGTLGHVGFKFDSQVAQDGKKVASLTGVVAEDQRFVCIMDRNPWFGVHLLCTPKTPMPFDLLGKESVADIRALAAFARGICSTVEREGKGHNMVVLFPTNPGQWQLHCHVVSRRLKSVELRMQQNIAAKFDAMLNENLFVDYVASGAHRCYATRPRTDAGDNTPLPLTAQAVQPAADYWTCEKDGIYSDVVLQGPGPYWAST